MLIFSETPISTSIGLLLIRLLLGITIFYHALLAGFNNIETYSHYEWLLIPVIMLEVLLGIMLAAGILTRVCTVLISGLILITLLISGFSDSLILKVSFIILKLSTAIFLTGPGTLSVDYILNTKLLALTKFNR